MGPAAQPSERSGERPAHRGSGGGDSEVERWRCGWPRGREGVKVAIDVDALGNQIAEMSAHIDAAMHRLLAAIREFDGAAGWHVQGALSCAHWLAWRVGWDLRTARERVRVARKLAALPRIDEQLRRGAMSYSQARAITRVATAEKEALWVAYAKRMPASQLDTLCRSYGNVQAYDQAHGAQTGAMTGAMTAAQVAAQRTVTRRSLDNGMVKLEVVLPSDEAAIVWAALNAAIDTSSAAPTPAEPSSDKLPPAQAPTTTDRGRQRASVTRWPCGARHYGQHQRLEMDRRTNRLCEVHRLFGVRRDGRASGQHPGLRRWSTCGMVIENVTNDQPGKVPRCASARVTCGRVNFGDLSSKEGPGKVPIDQWPAMNHSQSSAAAQPEPAAVIA